MLVSILAGVEVASLRKRFPNAGAIVRAMPNLPVAIRRGVVALYSEDADDALRQQLGDLFVALGWCDVDCRTRRSSPRSDRSPAPGPAYVARFIAALTKAGEARGLSNEIASTIALETVLGTAWMAATTRRRPWTTSRAASPAPTARPRPAWPCSTRRSTTSSK